MLRIFFKYKRRLLGDLCRLALRSLTHYFEALTGSELTPGVIVAIQTFGDRINLHRHLHLLLTEGGVDKAGVFHKWPRIDDSRLAAIFAREILADMVRKELLSSVWAERLSLDKEEVKVIYRIINHLKLRLIAAKSPPPPIAYQKISLARFPPL
jgi:hypothetical protein